MSSSDMVHDQSSSEPEETVTVVSRSRKAIKRSNKVDSSKQAIGGDVGELQNASPVPKRGIIKTNTDLLKKVKLTPSSKCVRFSAEVNSDNDSLSSGETDQDSSSSDYQNVSKEEEMDSLNDDSDSDNYVQGDDEIDHFDEDGMSFENSDGYESTGSSNESLIESRDKIEEDKNASSNTQLQEVVSATSSKYVPPHLRTDGKSSKNLERLKKRVQGLVNR